MLRNNKQMLRYNKKMLRNNKHMLRYNKKCYVIINKCYVIVTYFFPLKKPFTVQMTSSVLFIHINHSRRNKIKIRID